VREPARALIAHFPDEGRSTNGGTTMRGALLGMFLLILVAPAASAQTGKHVGIGGAIGLTSYRVEDFRLKNPGFALAYRITPKPEAKDGWRWAPKLSLGWSRVKTTSEIGGIRTPLGRLQTVPIMVGVQRA